MRITASKSEAMVLSGKRVDCPLRVRRELLPQVEEFMYLGVLFISEREMRWDIYRRIGAASAVMQMLKRSVVVKRVNLQVYLCPNSHLLSWALGSDQKMRSWIQAAEMSCLRRVTGLSLRDRGRSLDIQERVRVELQLLHVERSHLRWFRHLVRMPLGCLPGEVFKAPLGGGLYISAALGTSRSPPGGVWGKGRGEEHLDFPAPAVPYVNRISSSKRINELFYNLTELLRLFLLCFDHIQCYKKKTRKLSKCSEYITLLISGPCGHHRMVCGCIRLSVFHFYRVIGCDHGLHTWYSHGESVMQCCTSALRHSGGAVRHSNQPARQRCSFQVWPVLCSLPWS